MVEEVTLILIEEHTRCGRKVMKKEVFNYFDYLKPGEINIFKLNIYVFISVLTDIILDKNTANYISFYERVVFFKGSVHLIVGICVKLSLRQQEFVSQGVI